MENGTVPAAEQVKPGLALEVAVLVPEVLQDWMVSDVVEMLVGATPLRVRVSAPPMALLVAAATGAAAVVALTVTLLDCTAVELLELVLTPNVNDVLPELTVGLVAAKVSLTVSLAAMLVPVGSVRVAAAPLLLPETAAWPRKPLLMSCTPTVLPMVSTIALLSLSDRVIVAPAAKAVGVMNETVKLPVAADVVLVSLAVTPVIAAAAPEMV